jgi:carboxylesterase type B
MASYWANFAATGDPNGEGLPAWPAYSSRAADEALELGDIVQARSGVRKERLDFMDAYYTSQRSEPQ